MLDCYYRSCERAGQMESDGCMCAVYLCLQVIRDKGASRSYKAYVNEGKAVPGCE